MCLGRHYAREEIKLFAIYCIYFLDFKLYIKVLDVNIKRVGIDIYVQLNDIKFKINNLIKIIYIFKILNIFFFFFKRLLFFFFFYPVIHSINLLVNLALIFIFSLVTV